MADQHETNSYVQIGDGEKTPITGKVARIATRSDDIFVQADGVRFTAVSEEGRVTARILKGSYDQDIPGNEPVEEFGDVPEGEREAVQVLEANRDSALARASDFYDVIKPEIEEKAVVFSEPTKAELFDMVADRQKQVNDAAVDAEIEYDDSAWAVAREQREARLHSSITSGKSATVELYDPKVAVEKYGREAGRVRSKERDAETIYVTSTGEPVAVQHKGDAQKPFAKELVAKL